jgi:hypothetical protein
MKHFAGRIFLIGLDPGWPQLTLSAFFEFARSRGAAQNLAQIEHEGWSRAQLSAFMFDYLNCAAGDNPKSSSFQHFMRQRVANDSAKSLATCRFQSLGRSLDLETTMFITDHSDEDCHNMESVEAFRVFARGSHEQRLRAGERVLHLFDRATATFEGMLGPQS